MSPRKPKKVLEMPPPEPQADPYAPIREMAADPDLTVGDAALGLWRYALIELVAGGDISPGLADVLSAHAKGAGAAEGGGIDEKLFEFMEKRDEPPVE